MAGVFETQNVYLLSKYSNPFLQVFLFRTEYSFQQPANRVLYYDCRTFIRLATDCDCDSERLVLIFKNYSEFCQFLAFGKPLIASERRTT